MSPGAGSEPEAARVAPEYGEYASPEEQQERIRLSGGPSAGAVSPSVGAQPRIDGAPAGSSSVDPSWPAPLVARPDGVPSTDEAGDVVPPQPRRRRDRFVTIGLLAYGLFTMFTSLGQLIEYSEFAQVWIEMAGIDAAFTAYGMGRLWGAIAACVLAVGWLATALWSWQTIARGRISWWIPIVGAVVTFALVSICLSVPLLNDPSIMEALLRVT